jgi:medium-chain acyl-[acyl-carrier-protein] hydrolase
MTQSRWLVQFPSEGARRRTLFMMPFAGGGAAAFRTLAPLLPAGVGLTAVRLPGRESRMAEAPLVSMTEVVEQLTPLVAGEAAAPYALFGYSMGAIIAFELARRLQAEGVPTPRVLAVGGAEAPQLPRRHPPLHNLDRPDLVAAVQSLGGTPPEVFQSPELLDLVLPTLRADFELLETYRFEDGPPLDCPIVTVSAAADPIIEAARVAPWSDLTTAGCSHLSFEGSHFFFLDDPGPLVSALVAAFDRS